jgi:methionyl-tRNA synthetase
MTLDITTPIYYVNDVPHLGHAYTTICADALARFHRMRGEPTHFLTGTDEHGQKVEEAAQKRGVTPRQHVDDVAPRFAHTWRRLGISNDDFIRTTEPRHAHVLRALWRRLVDSDDLYLASYQGWYCVGCEAFYNESALTKDGSDFLCPTHKRPVSWVDKERTWFFRLSKYQQPLLDYIAAHPDFIQPEAYRNEVVSFVKSGLRDLSVSRTSFSWGVPIPDPDPEGFQHVMYVWMDALTNYLSALVDVNAADPFASPLVKQFWPAVHLIGKDILRFHAVYWPCFLLSAGLPLPKTVLTHGWWTVRGEKISKSMPATRIDPIQLARALGGELVTGGAAESGAAELLPGNGIDAMRYYLLREIPLGNDGDFTFESLFARYNSDLANDLGNLVNRATTLMEGQPARIHDEHRGEPRSAELQRVATEACAEAARMFTAYAPHRALDAIWRLVREGNRFVDGSEPWKLKKQEGKARELEHVLGMLHATLSTIAALIYPVLPYSSGVVHTALGRPLDPAAAPAWPTAAWSGEAVAAKKSAPLFPRFDAPTQEAIMTALLPAQVVDAAAAPAPTEAATSATPATASPAAAPAKPKKSEAAPGASGAPGAPGAPRPLITFDEFSRMELRVGQVVTAAAVPKAKKLLQLTVDLGEAAPRNIVAGLAEAFAPESLIGKKVLVVANLAPATIRGLVSEGMILAAGDDAILGLSGVDADVPPGTRVR